MELACRKELDKSFFFPPRLLSLADVNIITQHENNCKGVGRYFDTFFSTAQK